jgi:hypothetical protein
MSAFGGKADMVFLTGINESLAAARPKVTNLQLYQTEKNSLDYRWWSCMNIRPTDWERAAAFGDLFDVEMMPHYQDGGSSDHGHTR